MKTSIKSISLQSLADVWACPFVTRDEVERFSGGLIKRKTLQNLDAIGAGPSDRFSCGKKIAYPVDKLIAWLEDRCNPVGR